MFNSWALPQILKEMRGDVYDKKGLFSFIFDYNYHIANSFLFVIKIKKRLTQQ